ncbi:MAG: hypothetical protein ACXQTS_02920 [Candidatus Methanospirareceae archaeon]
MRVVIEVKGEECVETVAKRKYWMMVDEYIRSEEEDEEREEEIEVLREFLENKDAIRRYRSEIEDRIASNSDKRARLILERDAKGGILVDIEG